MGAGKGSNKRRNSSSHESDKGRDEPVAKEIFTKLEEICMDGAGFDNQGLVRQLLIFRAQEIDGMTKDNKEDLFVKLAHLTSKNQDPTVRCAAVIASARLRGKNANELLIRSLRDPSGVVRQASALAIGAFHVIEAHVTLAATAKQDKDMFVRSSARWSLKRLETDPTVQEAIVTEFSSFLDETNADDFARFNHYGE